MRAHFWHLEDIVHLACICFYGKTNDTRLGLLVGLHDCKQGVLCPKGFCVECAVSWSTFAKKVRAQRTSCSIIRVSDALHDFVIEPRFPEFEVGGGLQLLPSTCRIINAWQFDQNPSAEGQLLDIGLRHTELVNPLADDVLGIVDGSLCLGAEDGEDLFIGALLWEEVRALHVVEDAPEVPSEPFAAQACPKSVTKSALEFFLAAFACAMD